MARGRPQTLFTGARKSHEALAVRSGELDHGKIAVCELKRQFRGTVELGAGGGGTRSHIPILLLIALPACLAQFTIQGASDGRQTAQGLRVTEGKGIEYIDQNAPKESGFTIQGATDGHSQIQGATDSNSNFHIQGATDGHSNFQIQGASDSGVESYNGQFQQPSSGSYNIPRESDGHSQSIIQGSYDPSVKSLQYNDPSGLRVNWRSYDRQPRPETHQEVQQYSEVPVASAPRAPPSRQRAHVLQRQPQPQPQPDQFGYGIQQKKHFDVAPVHIKQLLQYQAQLPYFNIIPEQYRYDSSLQSQGPREEQQQQEPQYRPEPQNHPPPEPRHPAYRGKSRGPPRQRRQAPQHGREQQQQPYARISQPPPEPPIKYSPNVPAHLQQYLKFQAQTPYINVIPEQYRFDPEPSARLQLEEFNKQYENLLRQQPTSPVVKEQPVPAAPIPVQVRSQGPPRPEHSRQRRQTHYQQQQLPAEPVPQYSNNLPPQLQNLLKFQSQIPYSIVANQINYRPEKPYVPQPAQPSAPTQQSQLYQASQAVDAYKNQPSAYQDQPSAYQDQPSAYQEQPSGYNQVYASQPQYPQYSQAQLGYQQPNNGVRPVTENQY
ncbi:hypothetical protein WH47_09076 [Habropoda laboriosa]|uniref:Uncharacterized protein n=1 Tax=Habropoda laboriosa TaxID=597456 RepID=A0A0L7QLY1_9HYME|nr:hypothetical protein WH47_09076 [Habropoda laboriosa]